MSFFEDPFAIAATASLVIQIVVLGLIIYAVSLKNKQKFRQHGLTLMIAVFLHAITIFAVMIPSFINGFSSPGAIDFSNIIVVVALIHAVAGLIAFVLGLGLVASWRLKQDLQPCFQRKQYMRITAFIWVLALVLGAVLYLSFWVISMIV